MTCWAVKKYTLKTALFSMKFQWNYDSLWITISARRMTFEDGISRCCCAVEKIQITATPPHRTMASSDFIEWLSIATYWVDWNFPFFLIEHPQKSHSIRRRLTIGVFAPLHANLSSLIICAEITDLLSSSLHERAFLANMGMSLSRLEQNSHIRWLNVWRENSWTECWLI